MAKDNKMIWLGMAAVILFLLVGGSQLYVIAVPAGSLGDVSGDGFIGSIDALMAQNLAITGEYDPRADADGDGVITVADVQMILSASVGSTTFPTDVIDIPTTPLLNIPLILIATIAGFGILVFAYQRKK